MVKIKKNKQTNKQTNKKFHIKVSTGNKLLILKQTKDISSSYTIGLKGCLEKQKVQNSQQVYCITPSHDTTQSRLQNRDVFHQSGNEFPGTCQLFNLIKNSL